MQDENQERKYEEDDEIIYFDEETAFFYDSRGNLIIDFNPDDYKIEDADAKTVITSGTSYIT